MYEILKPNIYTSNIYIYFMSMRQLNKKYVKKIEEKHFLGPPLLLLCLIISALNNKIVSMSRTKDRFEFLEAQIVSLKPVSCFYG